jgi:hypothetical protein
MELVSQWPAVAQVLTYVVAFNIMLTGLHKGLDLIKDKTSNQVDNKVAAVLGKIVAMLSKLIDSVGFNPKH